MSLLEPTTKQKLHQTCQQNKCVIFVWNAILSMIVRAILIHMKKWSSMQFWSSKWTIQQRQHFFFCATPSRSGSWSSGVVVWGFYVWFFVAFVACAFFVSLHFCWFCCLINYSLLHMLSGMLDVDHDVDLVIGWVVIEWSWCVVDRDVECDVDSVLVLFSQMVIFSVCWTMAQRLVKSSRLTDLRERVKAKQVKQ